MAKGKPPVNIQSGSGQDMSYVVAGAEIKCSMGENTSKLTMPVSHGVFVKSKPQMNIMDFKPMMNIMPFGMCQSMANPTVAAATAANYGRLQKMPCMPAIPAPWISGKSDVLIENFPALMNKSTNVCAFCGKITIEDDGQS